MSIQAYPLHWPEGWPRTKQPSDSRFDTSLANARDGLFHELELLHAKNIILSTNIPLRNDGIPYARYKALEDHGVAVYFELDGLSQVFANDRWTRVEDNIQAIRKSIEAIRGLERWGSSDMLNRAFRGFQALPEKASESTNELWWNILGVSIDAEWEEVRRAFKSKSKIFHPDNPQGSTEKMVKLNQAYNEAKSYFTNIR